MALDKQIIREYGTYAELTQAAGDKELQMYMVGIANDSDEFIFRSSDGYHRCVDSGRDGTPLLDGTGDAVTPMTLHIQPLGGRGVMQVLQQAVQHCQSRNGDHVRVGGHAAELPEHFANPGYRRGTKLLTGRLRPPTA